MTMHLYRIRSFLLLLYFIAVAVQMNAQPVILPGTQVHLLSPDKNLSVEFYQKEDTAHARMMYFRLTWKNKVIMEESSLDIELDNHLSEEAMALKIDHHARWCENLELRNTTTFTQDTSWRPVCGERDVIRDHYNAATIELVKKDDPDYVMQVQLRAYNEGMALRYFFPEHPKGSYYRVKAERTSFTLPQGTRAWYTGWAQGPYRLLPLQNWPDEAERPLTLQLPGGQYACLAEAAMVDYARTKFVLSKEKQQTIVTAMHDPADLISPFGTPWRVVMVADKPGELIEHNGLLLNLNEPNKIQETGWIQPGKIMREMTLTTQGARAAIDFAAAHHLQYILFDWKWYGPAFSFSADATKVVVPLDMPGIIQYGKEKGVGIWLYVNQQALLLQKDSLFTVFRKWGIKGVQFGFVQVGSHRWTTWLEDAIHKAAENHIMVNIHDDWRPTGEQRTWPNLMTAEGIRGNEEMPDATHNTILPFTRFMAGPADYTICYYDPRIKTTHAHQLALAAIYYSPIQTLFWYDKPAAYHQEPEIRFFEEIPTVWDDTKVLDGRPGEFVAVARRSGSSWFAGVITNNEARTIRLPLHFLSGNKRYTATIYSDDPAVHTATQVKIEERELRSTDVLTIQLPPSGGQALWIREGE